MAWTEEQKTAHFARLTELTRQRDLINNPARLPGVGDKRHLKNNPNLTMNEVEEKEKINYKKYGFDCIIFWEDEIKGDKLLEKLSR